MRRIEEVEMRSHSGQNLGRSHHFGMVVPEVQAGLGDRVLVEAYGVVDLVDLQVEEVVQDLEPLDLLDQP